MATRSSASDPPAGLVPAAQYLRKSTDHQKYSTENQDRANRAYADTHGLAIVRSYCDDGISGLSFERREALRQLIGDVATGNADFRAILVYDVSRWGRFQDADESAHYEFICKRAGVRVIYCAEPFDNDGSPLSTMFKGLKRAMAGEYSRELSVKVHAGQSRLAQMGYRLGGHAGYGLRRMLIDQNGITKATLQKGEWKNISTDRIVLVPGPTDEVATVRWMYSLFVNERKNERQIAALLNERGSRNSCGNPWRHNTVARILRSEKYIGTAAWNRSSFRLQVTRVNNDRENWICVEGAFEAVVDRRLFDAAQSIFATRGRWSRTGRPLDLTDEQMLQALKDLWHRHGHLNRALIDGDRRMPSAAAYYLRFGTLKQIYQLMGYTRRYPTGVTATGRPRGLSDEEMLDALRRLWREEGYLTEAIIAARKDVPHPSAYFQRFGSLLRAYELIDFTPDSRLVRPYRLPRRATNEQVLSALRELLRAQGRLSKTIIDRNRSVPCHGTIERRFGGLRQVYRLIGYTPERFNEQSERLRCMSDEKMLGALRRLWAEKGYLSQALIGASKNVPSNRAYYIRFGGLSRAYDMIGYKRGRRAKQHIDRAHD